ncbi:tail fiber protein [Cohnella lubricantis]|uniref:Phage tail protein n=1 Tax=Cohnella lubricantis TaxID=2163172 RepID=A0A841TGW3_9BACL|nr:tail fiber protein [Cohnella lubricantis]MBB6678187.1 phage tail protein [Cohnella lubricantis]MBP2119686.1 microcystin-dependent protein [Cohnella lubricantis]
MSEAYLGEIRLFPMSYAPRGWAVCDGSLLSINQNQALFAIIGTTYGGDGRTTFALPDLRGRTPVFYGQGIALGQTGGEEAHTLTANEIPRHTHTAYASSSTATATVPAGNTWAVPDNASANTYQATADGVMSMQALRQAGASQPHTNMQPYAVVSFCICTAGIFPTHN